jgi:hypothetical protein
MRTNSSLRLVKRGFSEVLTGVKSACAVLLLLLIMSTPAICATTWDVTNDFSNTLNPNGAWTYGWQSAGQLGGTFTLSSLSSNAWWGAGSTNFWKNTSGEYQYGIAAGEVSQHPGEQGQFNVVRWTSPMAGTVTVSGSFGAGHSGSMSYYVYVNESLTSIWLNEADTKAFDFTTAVSIGDTIDFIVGVGNSGWGYGNTPLHATISSVPIPGAVWLFAPALAGLMGLTRRFTK